MTEPAAARRLRRLIMAVIAIALVATAAIVAVGYARRHPENLPWTTLDLTRPIGLFTGRKLAALRDEPGLCPRLLDAAGVRFAPLPRRDAGEQCSYADAVRLTEGGARSIRFRPGDVGLSCPVAAALALWEWHVIQPAAERHFGSRVEAIEHYGGYNCRRVNHRAEGDWSEHATANALDVAAFRLADGRRLSIVNDWNGAPEARAFLREVRDGGCRLFATMLSPDYNDAHRDHLHVDQAARGATGWRGCR